MNSRRKGKEGELRACEWFRARGYTAQRTQQYAGRGGDADIVVKELPWLHIEVKNREKLNVREALDQASRDCPTDKVPIVFWIKNRSEVVAVLKADHLLDFDFILGKQI